MGSKMRAAAVAAEKVAEKKAAAGAPPAENGVKEPALPLEEIQLSEEEGKK